MNSRREFLFKGLGLTGMLLYSHPVFAAARCMATEDNILGPFYRQGAPFRRMIAGPEEKGERLHIRGTVLDGDCRPLAGAVVDVWQADHDGRYDNSGLFNRPKPGEYRLRGRMNTNKKGVYEFETVLPGPYRIGFGRWRPRHIHYIVTKPGYESLTTQLFFSGDPYLRDDPFVKESLIIDLKKGKNGGQGTSQGEFDIVLAHRSGRTKSDG